MNGYEAATLLCDMVENRVDGTIASDGEPLPTYGYYVGGAVKSLVFDSPDAVDRGEVAYWAGKAPALFYGVWTDQETGKVYFDVSTWWITREIAMEIARAHGELAIWDIAGSREIRVGPISEG